MDQLCNIHMPSRQPRDIPKQQQQQEQRSSWWSWRRSKTSRETTPAPENANESSSKTIDTKDISEEIKEENLDMKGKIEIEKYVVL